MQVSWRDFPNQSTWQANISLYNSRFPVCYSSFLIKHQQVLQPLYALGN